MRNAHLLVINATNSPLLVSCQYQYQKKESKTLRYAEANILRRLSWRKMCYGPMEREEGFI